LITDFVSLPETEKYRHHFYFHAKENGPHLPDSMDMITFETQKVKEFDGTPELPKIITWKNKI
jgi:hypothetical protein